MLVGALALGRSRSTRQSTASQRNEDQSDKDKGSESRHASDAVDKKPVPAQLIFSAIAHSPALQPHLNQLLTAR